MAAGLKAVGQVTRHAALIIARFREDDRTGLIVMCGTAAIRART